MSYIWRSKFFFVSAQIGGSCVFSIGIFVLFDTNFADGIASLNYTNYYGAHQVLVVGSILLMLASVMGGVGTYFRSYFVLILVSVQRVLL